MKTSASKKNDDHVGILLYFFQISLFLFIYYILDLISHIFILKKKDTEHEDSVQQYFNKGKKKKRNQKLWLLFILFGMALGILYLIFSNIPTIEQ